MIFSVEVETEFFQPPSLTSLTLLYFLKNDSSFLSLR